MDINRILAQDQEASLNPRAGDFIIPGFERRDSAHGAHVIQQREQHSRIGEAAFGIHLKRDRTAIEDRLARAFVFPPEQGTDGMYVGAALPRTLCSGGDLFGAFSEMQPAVFYMERGNAAEF